MQPFSISFFLKLIYHGIKKDRQSICVFKVNVLFRPGVMLYETRILKLNLVIEY
jgi:hypothetical protein